MGTDRITHRLQGTALTLAPNGARVSVEQTDAIASVFTVSIRTGAVTHRLLTGWAGEGWPADVERLLRLTPGLDAVAAHHLSPGARDLLQDRGIGWFDETGAATVMVPSGLVIVREGAPKPKTPAQADPAWASSTIAVAEAILSGGPPRVESAQEESGLSRGAVAKALALLEHEGFLTRSVQRGPASGRRVSDADGLLDRYASAVGRARSDAVPLLLHRLWNDPITALTNEIAPGLEAAGVVWAATGVSASLLLAPYLSNITSIELYMEDEVLADIGRLEALLDARRVERGHRIELRRFPTRTTAQRATLVRGVRCAPAVRVYADLAAKGGRFAEAAHHLREAVIDARTRP